MLCIVWVELNAMIITIIGANTPELEHKKSKNTRKRKSRRKEKGKRKKKKNRREHTSREN